MYPASMCLCATMFPLKCQRTPQFHGPGPIWTYLIQHGLRHIIQVPCQVLWIVAQWSAHNGSLQFQGGTILYCRVATWNATSCCPGVQEAEPRAGLLPLPTPQKGKKPTHLSSPLKGGVKSPQPNSWYIPLWPACLRVSTIKASTTPCI